MRRLLIASSFALCVAIASIGPTQRAAGAPSTRCVAPSFRGQFYWPHTLRRTSLPVGARVGTAVVYRNWNLECFREEEFVRRLRGIAVGRAVSVDGSPRRLLIRRDVCLRAPYEAALVRCLKRGS